jgi:hypothetical protein
MYITARKVVYWNEETGEKNLVVQSLRELIMNTNISKSIWKIINPFWPCILLHGKLFIETKKPEKKIWWFSPFKMSIAVHSGISIAWRYLKRHEHDVF